MAYSKITHITEFEIGSYNDDEGVPFYISVVHY